MPGRCMPRASKSIRIDVYKRQFSHYPCAAASLIAVISRASPCLPILLWQKRRRNRRSVELPLCQLQALHQETEPLPGIIPGQHLIHIGEVTLPVLYKVLARSGPDEMCIRDSLTTESAPGTDSCTARPSWSRTRPYPYPAGPLHPSGNGW